ncbi:MAG: hypothetical protein C0412_07365 [Flavobacterium sp.]|nr:hypothetical protein [Flavobacterium sp.]
MFKKNNYIVNFLAKKSVIPVLLAVSFGCIINCGSSSDPGSSNNNNPPVDNGINNETLFGSPPDSIPKIFGKDIISITDRYEYGLAISPDYKELIYTAEGPGNGLISMTKREDGKWNRPAVPGFLTNPSVFAMEAFYNYEGNKLYFAQMTTAPTPKIWFVTKTTAGWSIPVKLDGPVNNTDVFYATFSRNNTMYFTRVSESAIYKSKLVDGSYSTVENAGLPFGVHPSISPDEDFIIFDYNNDIYIAFKNSSGTFRTPAKFGSLINTSADETCPSLSPDGKYIFFSRYNDTGNKSNIYWVSTSVIEKLR